MLAECGGDVFVLQPQYTHVTTILPITKVTQAVSAHSGRGHDVIPGGGIFR